MRAPRCTIRRATSADAAALAELAATTFREAYLATNDPAHVEAHIADNYGVETLAAELADPTRLTWFALQGDAPVGFLTLRPGATTPAVSGPRPMQLHRIYVLAVRYGQGDGAALMQTALDEGRRLGCATLWLSLWDQNHRAMAFYEKWGFAIVGTMPFLFGGVMYEDPVMARAIQSE